MIQKKLFDPNTNAVAETGKELIQETKSTTEAIETLSQPNKSSFDPSF